MLLIAAGALQGLRALACLESLGVAVATLASCADLALPSGIARESRIWCSNSNKQFRPNPEPAEGLDEPGVGSTPKGTRNKPAEKALCARTEQDHAPFLS